jgi:hypothetical protein
MVELPGWDPWLSKPLNTMEDLPWEEAKEPMLLTKTISGGYL